MKYNIDDEREALEDAVPRSHACPPRPLGGRGRLVVEQKVAR